MTFTLTGAVLIVYGAWLFLASRRVRVLQAIVFFSFFSGTAVVNFNTVGLNPAELFLLVLLLTALVSGDMVRPVRISRDHLLLIPLLGLFAVVSLMSLLINGGLHGLAPIEVTQTAYILLGVFTTLVLALEMARPDRLEAAVLALRAGGTFVAAWGVVQAGCYYAGIPYPALLFNNSMSHFADMFDQRADGGLIRIASVATEPSYMASSLMIFIAFGATLLVAEPRLRTRGWVASVGLAVCVLVASTSSTGYFGLAVLAVLLGLRRPGLMLGVGVAAMVAGTAILSLLPNFAAALHGATFGKAGSGSFEDRSRMTWDAMRLFLELPWLGGGWGSNFSFSIVVAILASVGIVGALSFAGVVAATVLASRAARRGPAATAQWRLCAYAAAAENALLVYLVGAIMSGFRFTILDFWALWALAIAIPSCMVCRATSQGWAGGRPRLGARATHPGKGPAGAAPLPRT